jgi:hypothetical protein
MCDNFERELRKLLKQARGLVHDMSMAEILHTCASEIGWDEELGWSRASERETCPPSEDDLPF